jgi:short-subunit dehydrogenase
MARVLITGAASGIGRAASVALARRGHEVIATARTEADVEALCAMAKLEGVCLKAAVLDVTNPHDRKQVIAWDPDVVINNAATGQSGPLADVPLDVLRATYETNVISSVAVAQAALPRMLVRGRGRIIMVSSLAGKFAIPYLGPYCMSKFALEAASDILRREISHHGIKVAIIEPGAIDTGFNERMNESKHDWFDPDCLLWGDRARIGRAEASLVRKQAPVHHVVKAIIHAVESSSPQRRYVAPGYLSLWSKLGEMMPSWLMDHYMR